MDIYTVSFFGHREVERAAEIENKLDQLLHDLITQKQYVEFLIGRDGEFDLLAASVIRRAIKQYDYGNTSILLFSFDRQWFRLFRNDRFRKRPI